MADDVRQRIVSSIFTRINAQGHQETYVAHVKIWEDAPEEGGKKPRYILISSMYGKPVSYARGIPMNSLPPRV